MSAELILPSFAYLDSALYVPRFRIDVEFMKGTRGLLQVTIDCSRLRLTSIVNPTQCWLDYWSWLHTSQPLQPLGAFYFFSHTRKPESQPPIPGTIAINTARRQTKWGTKRQTQKPGHTKTILKTFLLTSTLIPSTHSPITSLPIAITDAIGLASG